jgi:hypothetical protein
LATYSSGFVTGLCMYTNKLSVPRDSSYRLWELSRFILLQISGEPNIPSLPFNPTYICDDYVKPLTTLYV